MVALGAVGAPVHLRLRAAAAVPADWLHRESASDRIALLDREGGCEEGEGHRDDQDIGRCTVVPAGLGTLGLAGGLGHA